MEISDAAFDLLGDPIPPNWGKRGRPPHIPTQENRNKIILLLAQGWTNERIAGAIGITLNTLKRLRPDYKDAHRLSYLEIDKYLALW
jgi:DNA invertase Pin-like site-specific DNA recombinase